MVRIGIMAGKRAVWVVVLVIPHGAGGCRETGRERGLQRRSREKKEVRICAPSAAVVGEGVGVDGDAGVLL